MYIRETSFTKTIQNNKQQIYMQFIINLMMTTRRMNNDGGDGDGPYQDRVARSLASAISHPSFLPAHQIIMAVETPHTAIFKFMCVQQNFNFYFEIFPHLFQLQGMVSMLLV